MNNAVQIKKGKTKDIIVEDHQIKFIFTDRVTENEQGEIDPGGNILSKQTVNEQGKACLLMSAALFSELSRKGIKNHMISYNLEQGFMYASPAKLFEPNLEWVTRWVCTGSFYRRYNFIPALYDGFILKNPIHEITFKNDEKGDPLIVSSAISALGIVDEMTLKKTTSLNAEVMDLIFGLFAFAGLDLWDIKVEYGLDGHGEPFLIDEIGPGSCRAFRKDTKERINGMELAKKFEQFI